MSKSLASSLTVALMLGLASQSRAQDVGLPMKLTLKTVRDGTSGLELKPAKTTLDTKDVFELCAGDAPTKTQGLILATDCGVSEDGVIAVYDRSDDSGLSIGAVDFDYTRAVLTTANGLVKAKIVPFTLTVNCSGVVQFSAEGIADFVLQTSGDFCPTSIKGKITGTGDIDPFGELLIDDGSSFSASKPFPIPTS